MPPQCNHSVDILQTRASAAGREGVCILQRGGDTMRYAKLDVSAWL